MIKLKWLQGAGGKQNTELYRYLLGLKPPWKVERVKLDVINQRVDIGASHVKML